MPIEHRGLYVSTTLIIVISTTLVCGGLTEPMLSKMGMRSEKHDDNDSANTSPSHVQSTRGLLKSEVGKPNFLSVFQSCVLIFLSAAAVHHRTNQGADYDHVQGIEDFHDEGPAEASNIFHKFQTNSRTFIQRLESNIMNPLFGGPSVSLFCFSPCLNHLFFSKFN